jgi:ribosome recycling factor
MTEVKTIIAQGKEKMEKAVLHLEETLITIRAGKANPAILNPVMVDYYGSMMPINQVASINTPDAKTIIVAPWEKKMLPVIEKAILTSGIGLTPSNNGEHIRLIIPPLTEERRKELVKQVRNEGEQARVALRNIRRDSNESIKKLIKAESLPEDVAKDGEVEVQKIIDSYSKKIDELLTLKEKEIMTV